jgi:hypothetical protein
VRPLIALIEPATVITLDFWIITLSAKAIVGKSAKA